MTRCTCAWSGFYRDLCSFIIWYTVNSIYNFIPSIQRWIESEIKWKEVVQAVEKIQLAACSMSTNTVEMHPIYLGFFLLKTKFACSLLKWEKSEWIEKCWMKIKLCSISALWLCENLWEPNLSLDSSILCVSVRSYQLSRRWFSRSQNLHSLFFSFRVVSIVISVLFWYSVVLFKSPPPSTDCAYLHLTVFFVFFFHFCFKCYSFWVCCCYLKQKCVRLLNLCAMLNTTIFGRTAAINLNFFCSNETWCVSARLMF